MNAICACAAHHRWQHDHPLDSIRALEEVLGLTHLELLQAIHRASPKVDRREIGAFLRAELKKVA